MDNGTEPQNVGLNSTEESPILPLGKETYIPRATYRLQFNAKFNFHDAQALVPYLSELGISDCYASPIFKASSGSTHGYDVCDHSQLNPELGGTEGFNAFSIALRSHEMGLIVDLVPNHMGIGDDSNAWWMDVLENGPSSIYNHYFDIEWQPVKPELANKVLLPILEDQYGKVLESGKLRLSYEDEAFFLHHYELRLPIAPRTYGPLLAHQIAKLTEALGEDHEHVWELQSILTTISYLPPFTEQDPEKLVESNREKEVIKRRIATLVHSSPDAERAINETLQEFNGTEGDPRSFDLLDDLINAQAYRLAYWRVAGEEVNYRRFFDINSLAAIRVEAPDVFAATHQLIFRLLAEGRANGVRIDHIDGLYDPADYLRQFRQGYLRELANCTQPTHLADLAISSPKDCLPYVIVEKILSEEEVLPDDWLTNGTTGYDFLALVNGLFVQRANEAMFDTIYHDFARPNVAFPQLVNSNKKMIMLVSMASEIHAISHRLERIAEKNRSYRDFTLSSLTFAIREIIAALSIYRTYTTDSLQVAERDQQYVELAVAEAKSRNPRTAEAIFDFIRDTLLLRNTKDLHAEDGPTLLNWVMRFQQVTGPIMAKGVEDTTFYSYNRLISLNEVGGHPEYFGLSLEDFHQKNGERQQKWPYSLLTTSTHDTKRSEDVRARINVLAEMPHEWQTALERWREFNAVHKCLADGKPAPSANDEYLLYQALLGAWPFAPQNPEGAFLLAPTAKEFADFRERLTAYMQKATKEAKVYTSWVQPNQKYDKAVSDFVASILPAEITPFLQDISAFAAQIAFYGQFNALAQLLLKLTAPGVPDLYQGNELWDLSLVDPDNRRPVNYQLRRTLLNEIKNQIVLGGDLLILVQDFLTQSQDGRIKLYLTYRTLTFRRIYQQLFAHGDYQAVQALGEYQENVVAFQRKWEKQTILVVIPRFCAQLTKNVTQPPLGEAVWQDGLIALPQDQPGQTYRNIFTGQTIQVENYSESPVLRLATVFAHFPVALLEKV